VTNAVAIAFAGALIAAAILFIFRWEMAAFGGQTYRLDRWTGEIFGCVATEKMRLVADQLGSGFPYRCKPLSDDEIKKLLLQKQ
jgi:hypothetical protein